MASTRREGLPSFWTTHLAKVLTGDQPCLREPWMKGHMLLDKRPRSDEGSLALWKANHTEQLRGLVDRFKADGWKCDVERFFKVTGSTAIISGKADLIIQKADHRPTILDAKGGTPADSDAMQVLIEMVLIPIAWNVHTMQFAGQVHYKTHVVDLTPKDAEAIKPKLFAMLRWLGTTSKPDARPSRSACRFCDVNEQDCPDRFDSTEERAAETDAF